MRITNRSNFPEALVKAVENDDYDKGKCDYSVTELLKPPRQTALAHLFKADMVDDVEDRLWSLYGQIAHLILERANMADLVEKRFFAEFELPDGRKFTVSGQVDTLSLIKGILSDWKFTTSWGFKLGKPAKPEWVAQLNMQLEILRRNGLDANVLQIVGLLRDWSKLEALRTSDYPKKGIITVPIEIWSREQTTTFIMDRITIHENAKTVRSAADLPECTPEERWAKQDIWAVMRGERAIRFGLCFTEDAANQMQMKNSGTRIEFRSGFSTRCSAYCSVSEFCSQYQKTITAKVGEDLQ